MNETETIALNCANWKWNRQRTQAARLVAEGYLTESEISAKAKVSRRMLQLWKAHPEFSKRVAEIAAEIGRAELDFAIAKKVRRVEALNDRWQRLKEVIHARSKDDEHKKAPGGKTGLLVRQTKGIGSKDDFQVVEEFAVDTGLLKEIREIEKQAAIELNQWDEQDKKSQPGTAPMQVMVVEIVRDQPAKVIDAPPIAAIEAKPAAEHPIPIADDYDIEPVQAR